MRRFLPAVFVLLCFCIQCGEKCPIEPCRPECEDICGRVTPPAAFPLTVKDLTVLTVAGSGEVRSNWRFSVPALEGAGAQVVALAAEDTIPVMLGCAFPASEQDETKERQSLALDPALEAVVGSPYSEIRLSAASTALALVMINHFMGDAGLPERIWFAARVLDNDTYAELVEEVSEALISDPKRALDGVTYPGIYERAAEILGAIIARIEDGRPETPGDGGPYMEDLPGESVEFLNPAFIHSLWGSRQRQDSGYDETCCPVAETRSVHSRGASVTFRV
jgi:hypothetical protein